MDPSFWTWSSFKPNTSIFLESTAINIPAYPQLPENRFKTLTAEEEDRLVLMRSAGQSMETIALLRAGDTGGIDARSSK